MWRVSEMHIEKRHTAWRHPLQLLRLQLTSAKRTSQWYRTIHENTVALLEVLREGQTLDEIEVAFQDRPVGTYRGQLVSALARLKRAKADFERTGELGANAIIPEKEVIRARAEHESAEATYRALKEQIRFDAQQQALDSQQELTGPGPEGSNSCGGGSLAASSSCKSRMADRWSLRRRRYIPEPRVATWRACRQTGEAAERTLGCEHHTFPHTPKGFYKDSLRRCPVGATI